MRTLVHPAYIIGIYILYATHLTHGCRRDATVVYDSLYNTGNYSSRAQEIEGNFVHHGFGPTRRRSEAHPGNLSCVHSVLIRNPGLQLKVLKIGVQVRTAIRP